MKKKITLTGKAAEYYFIARCVFQGGLSRKRTRSRDGSGGQNSLNDTNPYWGYLSFCEPYPVLITEYRLSGKCPSFEGQEDMVIMDMKAEVL